MTKIGLVLGAGGIVGMSYHAGVLRALEVEGGVDVAAADLIVGTSAGSVVGAYLRAGWTTEDFWLLALGTHPELEPIGSRQGNESVFVPTFSSAMDFMRRGLGSAYVMSRSVLRGPLRMPHRLRTAFPGGMFNMEEGRARFAEELPKEWPAKALWLCAVDINTGRRVVLGREGSPEAPLSTAVLASCAIPGVYQPVRVGRMTLVDGGAHSTTNLDLAAKFGCDLIIGVAPMAFDTMRAPDPMQQLIRRIPTRMLSSEVAEARRRGSTVLMLRPSAREVRMHGMNMMRRRGLDRVAHAAYDATAAALQTDRFQDALAAHPAKT
ncbi:MAG: patatin-like phospholipase family protein [Actinobacteria bacterium]|nr:patatin-like phospholipase family protein [Actinomycetota bacterium]